MHVKKLWRGTAGAAAIFASGLLITSAAQAKIHNPFNSLQTVSDGELDSMRGGMWIGPFFFNFGLRIRTAVQGTMEMVTEMTMNPGGQWDEVNTTSWVFNDIEQGPPGQQIAEITPPDLSALDDLGTPAADPAPTAAAPTPAPAPTSDYGDGGLTLPTIAPPIPADTAGAPPAIPDTPVPTAAIADILPVLDGIVPSVDTPQPPAVETADAGGPPPGSPSGSPVITQSIADEGVSLSLDSGDGTEIIHEVTQGHIAAIVNNAVSNTIIETSTELDIKISNFQQIMAAALPAIKARAIASRINDAYFR